MLLALNGHCQSYSFESSFGIVTITVDSIKANHAELVFVDKNDSSKTYVFSAIIDTKENYIHLDSLRTQDIESNLRAFSIYLYRGELKETVCHAFSYDGIVAKGMEVKPKFMDSNVFRRLHNTINNGKVDINNNSW